MPKNCDFEKFEMNVIPRNEIKGADYNPRIISKDAEKRLRKMIAKHGLVQPPVWNKRTGNLVAGHQRLAALDALEKSQDYMLQVAVIDVPLREEKTLNVQLNNPSMQGDWDLDKLIFLADDAHISAEEMGFSESDAAVLFGETDFENVFEDNEDVKEAKTTLQEIKKYRAETMEKLKAQSSADFYFTVVCESDEQKRNLLKALGIPDWESFVTGRTVAAKMGL